MITVYGITNCDTVKKARRFLEERSIDYSFHDYRKQGVDRQTLERFVAQFGWEKVLNRSGTTWRKQPDEIKEATTDAASAIALMLEQPSAIKRPIVETSGKRFIGFDPVAWETSYELGEFA